MHGVDARLDQIELGAGEDERHHHLGRHRLAGLLRGGDGALENRPRLHLRHLREGNGDAAAAEAEHRVELVQLLGAALQLVGVGAHGLRHFGDLLVAVRQELVQGRIEQPDRHRQTRHDLEQIGEVAALNRQEFCQRGAAALLVVGENHFAHRDDAVALEEHVLGTAEADPLGPELPRHAGVVRRVGIGANAEAARFVRPFHDRRKLAGEFRLQHRDGAFDHLAGRTVDRDRRAFLECLARDRHRLLGIVDTNAAGARDARLAHAARDDRRMRGHSTAGGENAFGRMHAVDIFRARFDAHKNDLMAGAFQRLGFIRIEHDLSRRRAWRRRQSRREHIALSLGIDRRMQQLIEPAELDAQQRFVAVDQALLRHLDGNAQRGLGRTLTAARLQHPEFAALDGKLHVLHVAVVCFELLRCFDELPEHFRHDRLHRRFVGFCRDARRFRYVLRRADTGDDVLTLRVHQKLAVKLLVAGRGIAREGNASRRGLAHIAEDHRLHIHRCAPALGNVVQAAIGDRALVHPRSKHGADRAPELLARILRERLAALALDDALVFADDLAPLRGAEVGV